jgi:branched-chain amino acid transport system substrate-binding protein
MKKVFAVLAVVIMLTAMLSACGAAKQAECPAGDTCVTVGPDEPIRIGFMGVISGADASLGNDNKRGVEIAIDDRNGMLLDHKIELVVEDTLCNAEGGQTAATKLAADPKITGIVGTSCSSEARAGLPILCKVNIPVISPSNTAPDLTAEDRPADYWCYMRTAHNDKVQGAAMAKFAWEKLGVKKAATCHDGSLYADKLQQVFAEEFVKLGGTITGQEAVAPTDTDMKPMLTSVVATAPEFFYFPIFVAAGSNIISQSKQVPGMEGIALAGADGMFTPDVFKAAGDSVLGMYWSSPDFSAFGSGYEDFLAKHQSKYGMKPEAPFHAHGYDALGIIATSMEKVAIKNADGSLLIPRKALHDAMAATKDYKGLTGNLTCTPTGDCADPKIAVYECVNPDPASWNPGAAADSNPKKIWP